MKTIIFNNFMMLGSLLSVIFIPLPLAVKNLGKIQLANQSPQGFASIGWNG